MSTARAGLVAAVGLAWCVLCTGPSAAQAPDGGMESAEAGPPDAAAEAEGEPEALTPPSLKVFVPADYPPEAYEQQLSGSVVLEVEIGPDGFVRDATVREGAGHGFDEAARNAVLRFVFEPAMHGETPIPSKILYRYDFEWQPRPEEPTEPEAGALEVTVTAAQDDAPLTDATVTLTWGEGEQVQQRRASPDDQGVVVFEDLEPGSYEVFASAPGFDDQLQTEEVVAGQVTAVRYPMTVAVAADGYGARAVVEAPPREMTRRTIERDTLTRVAGTRGDALRTIQLLPGVARPPFGAGLVIIRGAAPQDSAILLNGTEVPLLYHFGGLTSFFNSRALERIDFYPGNFSARYGRQIGGIVDVEVRDPATDGYHGVLDVNVPLDSSLLVEGPITEKSSFLVAGRRSYFGEVVTAVIPEDTFDAFAAPVYYDAQAIVTYEPTPNDRVRALAYVSGDGLEVLFADAPASDPDIRQIEFNLNFQRMQLEWRRRYSERLTHDIRVSYGRNPNEVRLGPDLYFDLDLHDVTTRAEWRYQLSSRAALIVGTDSILGRATIDYRGPPPGQGEGNPNDMAAISGQEIVDIQDAQPIYKPGFYVETDLRPTEVLQLILGLRLDYESSIEETWFDPRLSTIYQVTEHAKLKAGIGVYSQPPQEAETVEEVGGNPDLEPTRAIHYGLGSEYEFNDVFSLGLEGFYKRMYDNVVGATPGEPSPVNFVNAGIGRIYGLELSGRAKGGERFFGFFSYTLMKSERNDRGEGWRPFDYDQRHILSVAGNYNFGNGWEIGGAFRLATGNPQTPLQPGEVQAPSNQDEYVYEPEAGPINSIRAPTFHRLDLRVQRKWTYDAWALALYLDVQNVYNAENPEGIDYNFNYVERAPVRGLPIIPALGLRGEM